VKAIEVGHRKVDVVHDSQDWHDVRLLTCRGRLTDHYTVPLIQLPCNCESLNAAQLLVALALWLVNNLVLTIVRWCGV
jgi:hypothetical protein